ncbi:MAG: peroxiredoxin [Burkholderiales bacterium]
MKNLYVLPDNLPVPLDDGACDHLLGSRIPSHALAATSGRTVDLSAMADTLVIYFYPMIGRPDSLPLVGWNEIPGARGCTPQSCAFRDHHAELTRLGARVFGVSSQSTAEQCEAHARLHLPFELLSDARLFLAGAWRLPTFEYAASKRIKRLTLITIDGVVRKVFYPVFPPDKNAGEVMAWLKVHPH